MYSTVVSLLQQGKFTPFIMQKSRIYSTRVNLLQPSRFTPCGVSLLCGLNWKSKFKFQNLRHALKINVCRLQIDLDVYSIVLSF